MTQDSHTKHAGMFALYASIILLALNGIFAKVIPLGAVTITQARSVVAALALFLWLLLQHSTLRIHSVKQFLGIYGLGVLLGLHWVSYFYAMQVSTVAIGMLSLFSYPVITVILEPLFKKHLPAPKDVIAATVVFLGILLMVSQNIVAGQLSGGAIVGALWGVASAFLFSLRNTSQKYLFSHVNSVALMAHQMVAVGIILIPFIEFDALRAMPSQAWLMLLLLGCFSTALAHTFLSISLKRLKAKSVALISCTTPFVGTFLAWLVLNETPELMVYVGGFVILSVAVYETMRQQ